MLLRGGTASPSPLVVRKHNMVQQHTNVIILLNTSWLREQDSSGIRAGQASPLDLRWRVQNKQMIQDISSYFWRRVGTACSRIGPKIAF